MIKHLFKIIWKQKLKTSFFVLQLILVFWVVFAVFAFGISKIRLAATPIGFDWENNYLISVDMGAYADSSGFESLLQVVKSNLLALGEVDAVSYSTWVAPYMGNVWSQSFSAEAKSFYSSYIVTDDDYAKTWNLNLKEGRYFKAADLLSKNIPVVVNQKLIDENFKGQKAIGLTFQSSNLDKNYEVIGLLENFKYGGEFSDEEALLLMPITKNDYYQLINLRLKRGVTPEVEQSISNVLKRTFKSSEFTIINVKNKRTETNNATYIPLGIMLFLSVFLLINITMGLFGILRYNIAGRTSEIGLRKALGARASAIRKQFTGEMMVLTFLAFLVAFLFAVQLPVLTELPVPNQDFYLGIAAGTILIFAIVYLCTLWPAGQAAKLLPADALHED